jgi:predicted lipoprotein with Yx(FWY)xxD motif
MGTEFGRIQDGVRTTLIATSSGLPGMVETRGRFLAAVGASIAVAGCQDGGAEDPAPTQTDQGGADDPTATPTDGSTSAPDATVSVRDHDELGDTLVNGEGMTLCMFDSDTQGAGESTCSGAVLTRGRPSPSTATPSPETTSRRTSPLRARGRRCPGRCQRWPLYYYASDGNPGDVTGHGVRDVWWVLDPAGGPVRPTGETATATATATDDFY